MPSTDTRAALVERDAKTVEQARRLVQESREAAASMGRFDLDPIAGRRPTAALVLLSEMVRIVDDFLAHSAPEERGEGDERLRYGLHQMASGHWQTLYEATNSHHDVSRYVVMQRFAFQLLASPPAPVEGERPTDWHGVYSADGRLLFVETHATNAHIRLGWCGFPDHAPGWVAPVDVHPGQVAGGGERETPTWPRGYTVRIAVEALEGVSVCASLSEQDPDGAWVVMREVTECPTVDAALRALASWEPAPLPQRMECPYCLAVWRPVSVADAECCPSCLRDLPPLASPAPSAPEEP